MYNRREVDVLCDTLTHAFIQRSHSGGIEAVSSYHVAPADFCSDIIVETVVS